MNCGNSDRYSMAIFGFSRFVTKPIANSLRGPSTGRSRTWNGERPPGLDGLPCQPEQIERAAEAQRVVGERHREQQRGDAERRAQHVEHEAERDAAERNHPGRGP